MSYGATVRRLEQAFAKYVGAEYAIAMCNGTATLHIALECLDMPPLVTVPPLTMAATSAAILHAALRPWYVDVNPETWVANSPQGISVSLYGAPAGLCRIDDAAQRLGPHDPQCFFTSYSFQNSKHLSAGEGGMLVTNHEELADLARSLSSLGYKLDDRQPRIVKDLIKPPTAVRHINVGWNYRMSDVQAERVLESLGMADTILAQRAEAAHLYELACRGCSWITPQKGNVAWWTYAAAVDRPWQDFTDAIVRHGGERPYGAWRLTYTEPAYQTLPPPGPLPVVEALQPKIVQFQTNNIVSARRNALALQKAIEELN